MLLRWSAFIFFVAGLAIASSLPARAQSTNADRVWQSLSAVNPDIGRHEPFIRDYVARLESSIGQLDNFIDVMDGKAPYACNLLCMAKTAPAFFRPVQPSPFDLIRYVFTATCYGVVPDPQFRPRALADLEVSIRESMSVLSVRPSAYEGWILREILGEAAKSVDQKFPKQATFPWVRDLWKRGYRSSDAKAIYPTLWVDGQLSASRKACEAATPLKP
jgi:hypothetical protein